MVFMFKERIQMMILDTRRKTKGKAPKQVDGWTGRNPIMDSSLQDLVTG